MPLVAWLILIAAAVLEVAGDAVIRKGVRGSGITWIAGGFAMLGCYGLVVNILRWDFSRMLGVYVAVFAVVSVLAGRFIFWRDDTGRDLDRPGHHCRWRLGDPVRSRVQMVSDSVHGTSAGQIVPTH